MSKLAESDRAPLAPAPTPLRRVEAATIGVALVPAFAYGLLVAILACDVVGPPSAWPTGAFLGPPRSWTGFAGAVVRAVGVTGIAAAILLGSLSLLGWAVRARPLRRRTTVRIIGATTALVLASLLVKTAVRADEVLLPPSCDGFRLDPSVVGPRSRIPGSGEAAPGDPDVPSPGVRRALLGVARCDILDGRTVREVMAALGRPSGATRPSGDPFSSSRIARGDLAGFGPVTLAYGALSLDVRDDRVASSRITWWTADW